MRFRAKRDENQLCNISIKSENFGFSPQCALQGEASKYIWTFAHKGTFHSFGKIKVRQFLLIFKHYAKVPFGVCVCFLHTPLYLRRKSNHINGREMVNLPMELYVGGNNSTWRSRWTCNAKMESLQRRKMWLSHETLLLRLLQLQ